MNPAAVLICFWAASAVGLVLMRLQTTVESRYRRTIGPALDGSHDLLTTPLSLKEWEVLAALDFTPEGAS